MKISRIFLILGLLVCSAAPARAQMDELFKQAQARMAANDPDGAIPLLEQALSLARQRNVDFGIADFSLNLGLCYDAKGQYDRAIGLYQDALSVYQQRGDKNMQASALMNIGISYKNKGENASALDWQNRALAMARSDNNRGNEASALSNLGNVYAQMGDHQKALEAQKTAFETHSALGDKAGMTVDVQNMAAEQTALGDYKEALASNERGLALAREVGDKIAEAGVLNNFGETYTAMGDAKKGMSYYEQALPMFRGANDDRDAATDLNDMGVAFDDLADFPSALKSYRDALAIFERLGDKHGTGPGHGNVGSILLEMGDYPAALAEFNQALSIQTETGDKRGISADDQNIAQTYVSLGDPAKAVALFEAALKLAEETADRAGQAYILANLGDAQSQLGDPAKAVDSLERAIKMDKDLGIPSKIPETRLGGVYLAQGDLAKAAALAQTAGDDQLSGRVKLAQGDAAGAKALFEKAVGEAKAARSADDIVAGDIGLCLALEKLARPAPARAACEAAAGAIEEQRDRLSPSDRAKFLSGLVLSLPRVEAYKARARLAADPADGLYWAENAKARAFVEAVSARMASSASGLPPDLAAREAAIDSRISGDYKQSQTAFEKKNTDRVAELDADLKAAKAEREALVSRLRKDYPAYAAVRYPQPVRADALALNPGEVLVEYAVTDSKTLIYVARADKKVLAASAPVGRKELEKLVAAWRKPFENPVGPDGKLSAKLDAAAQSRLSALLLKPVLAAAPKGSKLVIVPDEALALLPFEALYSRAPAPAKPNAKAAPARFLSDDYDVAYAQSATALTLTRALAKNRAAGEGFLVLADPIFDKSDERLKGTGLESYVASDFDAAAQGAVGRRMGVGGSRSGGGFERLDQTGILAESLKTTYGGAVVALTGKDASKTRLLQEDLGRYRYLVFATHGVLDSDLPYLGEPALVLTQIGNPSGDDGFLKMSEIMGLKLNSDVVALTACKTGVGKSVGGEGVMGLGRAFQYAGARNVLVSLWSVSEKSTTLLAEEFFKALKAGKTPREALAVSRAAVRKAGFNSPFYWTPFILVGS